MWYNIKCAGGVACGRGLRAWLGAWSEFPFLSLADHMPENIKRVIYNESLYMHTLQTKHL